MLQELNIDIHLWLVRGYRRRGNVPIYNVFCIQILEVYYLLYLCFCDTFGINGCGIMPHDFRYQ